MSPPEQRNSLKHNGVTARVLTDLAQSVCYHIICVLPVYRTPGHPLTFHDSGPTLVSPSLIPDPSKLRVRGLGNKDEVLQDCGTDDLIFGIPKLISFLSQSTTLPPGTVIITGTPAGVGFAKKPKYTLRPGEEFKVEILPHIGTLVNVFEEEK